jgi:hypothetical protein
LAYKVLASSQAAIATWSSVTKALDSPLPFPLPQIDAASRLAQGLAAVARINGIQFAGGGEVPSGYELPFSTSKGDNTLILAKPGEVVLNQDQQLRAGGADFFKSIGVPGFQTGGVIPQQTITNITNSVQEQKIIQQPVLVLESFDQVREGQINVKTLEDV